MADKQIAGLTAGTIGLTDVLPFQDAAAASEAKKTNVTQLQTAMTGKQDTLVSATNIKTINGSSVLGSGDLTVGLGYNIYTALLSYDGSNVTATQLQNTIGDGSGDGTNDIQWAFAGGFFVGTMTSGNPFTDNKTGVLPSTYWNLSNALYNLVGVRNSSTVIRYYSVKTSDGSLSTSNITNALIEIRVYP